MLFEVNTNNNSLNSQRNLKRINNLLSIAVSGLSAGLKPDQSADDASGIGVSENLDKHRDLKYKRSLSLGNELIKIPNQISDQILTSPSGWVRMGALFGESKPLEPGSAETASENAYLTRQEMIDNPEKVLGSQANQSPQSVMKLLE